MNKRIYLVGGSKGGVGKSMVTMALADYLSQADEDTFLIDSDTSNADVHKAYSDELEAITLSLDDANGWIELVNLIDANQGRTFVINTAARNNQGVTRFGGTLASTLGELSRDLVTLWVINRQRDSLELLNEYREALPDSTVHVIRNGYFGDEDAFELYNGSKVRQAIEGKGGKSLTFPNLADRVSDDIYTKRLSLAKAAKELPIGNRAELRRWLGLTAGMFGQVVS